MSGRGLRSLTIVGFPITFDATAVTADRFNVDFGSVGTAAVSAPTTYSLVPGIYSMCVPASNNCFAFSVSLGGLLGFSASLDGFVSGRNTGTLTVRGFRITIDATGESATTFNVDFGSVGSGPNQATSGHTGVDIVWTDGRLYLRAERSGSGPGRTYTIHCTATDTSGNVASKDATVTVAH